MRKKKKNDDDYPNWLYALFGVVIIFVFTIYPVLVCHRIAPVIAV